MSDTENIIQLVADSTGLLPSVVRVCLEAAVPFLDGYAYDMGHLHGMMGTQKSDPPYGIEQ